MDSITKKKISKKLSGRKRLATTKHLISLAMKNKPKSKEHKKRLSESLKNYWNKKKKGINK